MLKIMAEPPEWKALLGFDFDGTLLVPGANPPLDPRFFESVRWVRENYGAAWGICTGRSLFQLVAGFTEGGFTHLPDFVVAREREIYFSGQYGRWVNHDDWNKKSEKEHAKLFKKCRRHLKKVRNFVADNTGARWVSEEGDPAGIVAGDSLEMNEIVEFIAEMKLPPELTHERNGIYLRFSHASYNKGTALLEAGNRWGIGVDRTLAVGDNLNDISMLAPEVCEASGCPSNSVDEVKELIRERGGVVAKRAGSQGVIEILGKYFDP